jgi:hypothetical protein
VVGDVDVVSVVNVVGVVAYAKEACAEKARALEFLLGCAQHGTSRPPVNSAETGAQMEAHWLTAIISWAMVWK